MPNCVAVVDGWPRTLTCVVVMPSMGVVVGVSVGGIGVRVADGTAVEGRVEVIIKGVGVGPPTDEIWILQPATTEAARIRMAPSFCMQ